MSEALANHIPIWGLEDDFILHTDGSIGFAFEIEPLDIATWQDDQVNELMVRIGAFLNGLPTGLDVQLVQDIGRGNGDVLSSFDSALQRSPAATELADDRLRRIKELESEGRIPRQRLRLFVRKAPARKWIAKHGIFGKFTKIQLEAEASLAQEVKVTSGHRDEISQSLRNLGVEVRVIGAAEVTELMYRQWNPDRAVALDRYDPEDVRPSVLFTDLGIESTGFSLGARLFRVISLKLLPEQTFAGMATALSSLPFDSRLFMSIHVPDQTTELESLQTQRRVAFSMARGKVAGVSDIDSEAKLQDLETLLEQMIAQGEKVFHVSVQIVLSSVSAEELQTQAAQALQKVRELGGAEAMVETLASWDVFSEVAIPHCRARTRVKRMKTSNLADLFLLYGPWRGHVYPGVLLRSRSGGLLAFDPFDSASSNFNQIVSGGSGSGKSFFTNLLLLQTLKENPRIFIVDIGGSYRKFCANLGGQYIRLSLEQDAALNPFDLINGETVPSNEKIKFLLGLVELMTKEETTNGLPRVIRAELEAAIQAIYVKERTPRLMHLRQNLLDNPDTELRKIGRILSMWCGNTPYGRFIDRETTVKLDSRIVCFDLKGLESHPDLQAVCLFMITDLVWREVQRDS